MEFITNEIERCQVTVDQGTDCTYMFMSNIVVAYLQYGMLIPRILELPHEQTSLETSGIKLELIASSISRDTVGKKVPGYVVKGFDTNAARHFADE